MLWSQTFHSRIAMEQVGPLGKLPPLYTRFSLVKTGPLSGACTPPLEHQTLNNPALAIPTPRLCHDPNHVTPLLYGHCYVRELAAVLVGVHGKCIDLHRCSFI